MHKRIKLKPITISLIYIVVTISLVMGLMTLGGTLLKAGPTINYITSSTITEDVKPVIKEEKIISKPYIEEDVNILQNYYDIKDDKGKQEKSLILYENTYLQNSGIDYGKEEPFKVIAIYPGKVIDVREDNILGKIVEIQHSNNLISSYQCIDNIRVKKDDTVILGEEIGTTSTCNINKNLGNHLHLEVSHNGIIINPETIYGKSLEEINVQ